MDALIHHSILLAAERSPDAPALRFRGRDYSYQRLAAEISAAAARLVGLGLRRGDRVGVYLDKSPEAVVSLFGVAAAGGVFVPINPVLKAEQVVHILKNCGASILVTTGPRLTALRSSLQDLDLAAVIVVGEAQKSDNECGPPCIAWHLGDDVETQAVSPHRVIDTDPAAILYTSGSTGLPKGVVLSHRNLVAGAQSVCDYLDNDARDRILCVLPLSFDYGLSQLTTAFRVGACAVLMSYLFPRDVIRAAVSDQVTGIAAVPSLWIQLAELEWPSSVQTHLRYITSSGGVMPQRALAALRAKLQPVRPFLMYGLTEAFRSTYLPPEEIDRRAGSIGKAIPNAEVSVVRPDGTPCDPGEIGELVHRGALVALGYWNDPQATAEHFRPAPNQSGELPLSEVAVWSGDMVKRDEEGYLYFVERRDAMIKTSGYRVSPTEVESVVYATGLVAEAAAVAEPHPVLGQVVVLVVSLSTEVPGIVEQLLGICRERLPAYMVPSRILCRLRPLPRSPNGKIDRAQLRAQLPRLIEDPRD
ncbi:acyl-CoA ligase (AMP-forming), exosortase A system-associated [Thiorhodococcus drewsii]|uniref:acyl-CoA ligase (AMP-forming), exosortase A system-associated n=1 Tax=Thiorhodococcus drewsii TaxID=210408 RepID=UPI0005950D16|nr:acyl-CoA ligase (AMP-forming), exosortase A system-associated [Thiorhodococcus drewsii]